MKRSNEQRCPEAQKALKRSHGCATNETGNGQGKDPTLGAHHQGPSQTSPKSHSPFMSTKNDAPVIAETPEPPYYAVIFSSLRTDANNQEYADTAQRMVELAAREDGFLGVESAREGLGITVSYWKDAASIKHWKGNCEHLVSQDKGRKQWYQSYKTRVCKVERDYGFSSK